MFELFESGAGIVDDDSIGDSIESEVDAGSSSFEFFFSFHFLASRFDIDNDSTMFFVCFSVQSLSDSIASIAAIQEPGKTTETSGS